MGKRIWLWAAGGLLATGGVYLSARNACVTDGPLARVAAGTACTACCVLASHQATETGEPGKPPAASDAGPTPAAAADPAPTSPAPPPIVIREEEPPAAEQCEPDAGTNESAAGRTMVAASTDFPARPSPVAEDRVAAAPPRMPYCGENVAPEAPAAAPHMPRADQGPADDSSWAEFIEACGWPLTPEESIEAAKAPDGPATCREDPRRHDDYSGCPCPNAARTVPVSGKRGAPVDKGADTCGKPSAKDGPQMYKAHHPGDWKKREEDCPRHPEVDTMEYRRTDGGLNEYGRGGPDFH
jgi:hypothetical protein